MTRTLRFAFSLFTVAPLAAYAAHPLVVKTDKGEVRGTLTTDGQVRAFKAIPFAAPPVGDLRWQPPQPTAIWKGVLDATQFGVHCMQSGGGEFHVFRDPGASEDCLMLNVWAPADAKKRNLPVMVWIYGGGFRAGGASEPRQDGEELARHDVVIVSMNYRLGIFGFFVHPELVAESPHHAAGNYGLMDQSAALDWVQKNIASFGGDPHNVTIFGQSAGSLSVSALMASPISQGLFEKAIGESGAEFGTFHADSLEPVEQEDAKFAQEAFGTSKLADLRKIPAEDLLKKTLSHIKETHASLSFWPDVDGWFLPESVPQIYAEGKQAHVPLLAGWTADEQRGSVILAKPQPTAESFKAKEQAEFGSDTAEFLKLYPATTDEEALRSAGDLADDRFISYSTWRWLETQVETGKAPVYRYRFDLGSPGDKQHLAVVGAFHSDDIDYVFGMLDSREGAKWRPEDRKLSGEMIGYWTNFARTGNPNGDSLPKWPAYGAADNWQVMHLDATSAAKPDTQRERYLFLDKTWGRAKDQKPGN
jgi:para-nitrobenzyl esterase